MAGDSPSISHLLRQYEDRLCWNENLKCEELQRLDDAVVKRRALKEGSASLAPTLTVLLQRSLSSSYAALEWLSPFRRQCTLAERRLLTSLRGMRSSRFGLGSIHRPNRPLISVSSLEEKLGVLKCVCSDMETTIAGLTADFADSRRGGFCTVDSALITKGSNRAGHIADGLFQGIAAHYCAIQEVITESESIARAASTAIEEHRACVIARRSCIDCGNRMHCCNTPAHGTPSSSPCCSTSTWPLSDSGPASRARDAARAPNEGRMPKRAGQSQLMRGLPSRSKCRRGPDPGSGTAVGCTNDRGQTPLRSAKMGLESRYRNDTK
jgi:hypothetical protein